MDSNSLELETCSKDGDATKPSTDEKSSKENDRFIDSKNENKTLTSEETTNSKDLKSSKFNDRQMRGRLAVDEKDRCSFFVHRKKRTCRMMVKPGKRFCGEHANQEVEHEQQTAEASGK